MIDSGFPKMLKSKELVQFEYLIVVPEASQIDRTNSPSGKPTYHRRSSFGKRYPAEN